MLHLDLNLTKNKKDLYLTNQVVYSTNQVVFSQVKIFGETRFCGLFFMVDWRGETSEVLVVGASGSSKPLSNSIASSRLVSSYVHLKLA